MLGFNEAMPASYSLLKQYAHQNRLNMTFAERLLWSKLRGGALGHKFLRQYIIGEFIVDFICRDEGLIIEVDGAYHSEPQQLLSDNYRDEWLRSHGYHVMRFTNEEVVLEIDQTISTILRYFD